MQLSITIKLVYNMCKCILTSATWAQRHLTPSVCCSVVLPGNPGICGNVPGALEAVQLTAAKHSHVLNATSFGACSADSNSDAPIMREANLTLSTYGVLVGLAPK